MRGACVDKYAKSVTVKIALLLFTNTKPHIKMAGKPEIDHVERHKHHAAMEARKKKSLNWDNRKALLEKHISGQRLKGWPFDEGVPYNKQGIFQIITAEGEILQATLDLSTQYRAEGIQWNSENKTLSRQQVAAWKET